MEDVSALCHARDSALAPELLHAHAARPLLKLVEVRVVLPALGVPVQQLLGFFRDSIFPPAF